MRNIKLTIQYDGTNYSGWQTQGNGRTVQEEIEKALRKILGSRVKLTGAGRTDAGVHALGQAANFRTGTSLDASRIMRALNNSLPGDIVISGAREVPLKFNSRHNSKSKLYRYTIVNGDFSNPMLRNYSAFVFYKLDVGKMKSAARLFVGRHDFKSFEAVGAGRKDAVRRIKKIHIQKVKEMIYIDIEADGFLYNMARNIVGTLIEIGRGKMDLSQGRKILRARDRALAGPTAPARGLCLVEVKY